jgi:hypothetical protein
VRALHLCGGTSTISDAPLAIGRMLEHARRREARRLRQRRFWRMLRRWIALPRPWHRREHIARISPTEIIHSNLAQ